MDELRQFYGLAVALALGLLVGLERGWKEREAKEGSRVAGLRTYGLIGLLGGVWALLAGQLGELVLGLAFLALAVVLMTSYVMSTRGDEDIGITGIIAALLTFAFGAMAVLGYTALAAASAVITTILLGLKPVLHRWISRLERHELYAAFKLLLISVVLLPILPDRGFGPWGVFNPYKIWWMVVLIAGISFVGYFAVKIVGERKGVMLTGLFAGLASSTAVTLSFSRVARKCPGRENVFASGILVACATMFPRMLLVSSVLSTTLAQTLLAPLLAMTALAYTSAFFLWRRSTSASAEEPSELHNPFEIGPALGFAAILAAILFLSRALQAWLGDAGLYLLSAVSGITDVDAINLSISSMVAEGLAIDVAALSLVIAAGVNSLVKGGLATVIGGRALGLRVGGTMLLVVSSGLAVLWLT